ncbi:hypothetical protein BH23PLA1_BH23PLA1_26230 [soil metagenome]
MADERTDRPGLRFGIVHWVILVIAVVAMVGLGETLGRQYLRDDAIGAAVGWVAGLAVLLLVVTLIDRGLRDRS